MVFFILALTIVLVGLFIPARLSFKLHFTPSRSDLFIDIRVFYRLVAIPLHVALTTNEGKQFRLFRIGSDGTQKPVRLAGKKRKAVSASVIVKGIKIKRLSLYSRIGTGEADKTALTCGALGEALQSVFSRVCNRAYVSVFPDFAREVFILKLEGILHINHVKIILKAISKR